MRYCCNTMKEKVEYVCDKHKDNMWKCSDNIIFYNKKFDEYGLIVHNGGQSYMKIAYCPWCGKKLPESKRDLWFDELEKLGIKDPLEEIIPNKFNSDEWWNEKK